MFIHRSSMDADEMILNGTLIFYVGIIKGSRINDKYLSASKNRQACVYAHSCLVQLRCSML